MVFREGRAPSWVFSLQRVIHSRSCSYYLFFNYSLYLYVTRLVHESGGCVTRLVLDNSLESPAPVDKPHGGKSLRTPQERLSAGRGTARKSLAPQQGR